MGSINAYADAVSQEAISKDNDGMKVDAALIAMSMAAIPSSVSGVVPCRSLG